jgi:hypothetical protein
MRRVWLARAAFVVGVVAPLSAGCGDAARGPFDEAAALDRARDHQRAVEQYMKVHADAPESRYGKLARARAEVVLLQVGAQALQEERWSELDGAAGKLLELDPGSAAGGIYRAHALAGQGKLVEAQEALAAATGTPQGVTPPSQEAVEATALALFGGAEAGARSTLEGSIVDEQFLKNARARLSNTITRAQTGAKRRADLVAAGTLEAMATLLDNYGESDEAAAVRRPYAEKVAAKLRSIETVGPPAVEDPDPISTLADALSRRAPDEAVSKAALASVKALREQWEAHYEEELQGIDAQVAEHHAKRMDEIAAVITTKCAPARGRLAEGAEGATEALAEAREEAAKLVPNGLSPTDLQEVSMYILANCTPPRQE